jgi:hypothetical protein
MTRDNIELADAWAALHPKGTYKNEAEARQAWAKTVGPGILKSQE